MNSPDVKVKYSQRPSQSLRQNPRSVCSVLAQSNWKIWLAFMPRCDMKSPEKVIVGILSICLKTTLWKPNLIKHLTAQNSVNGDPFFKKFWWIAVHTPSFKMEHWEWLGMTFGQNTFTHCPLTHPSILQVISFDQKRRIYTIMEEDLRGKQGDGRRGFELWVIGEECEEGELLGRWAGDGGWRKWWQVGSSWITPTIKG